MVWILAGREKERGGKDGGTEGGRNPMLCSQTDKVVRSWKDCKFYFS